MTAIRLLMVSLLFKGCLAAGCTQEPVLIWPLGGGIGLTEIKNNSVSGTLGSVLFGTGLADVGNYNVLECTGTNDSFVDINVPVTASLSLDYSVMFYMKLNNISSSSTVLHYRSCNFGSTPEIGEFTISVINGDICINFTNFGSVTWNTNSLLISGQWHHVVYSRDLSKTGAKLYLDGNNLNEILFNSKFALQKTISPGVLGIGRNMNGSNSLSGAVTCLQIVPCKDAMSSLVYGPKCNQTNWPITTPSSAPTTTTIAPTITTIAPTTTASAPTTTSSAPTTTGASTAITMLPTTTTPNSANLDFVVITGCNHYRLTGSDATFGNQIDIIDVLIVSNTAKCSLECDRDAECSMFAVASQGTDFECKLGVKTSTLMNLTGSKVFEK